MNILKDLLGIQKPNQCDIRIVTNLSVGDRVFVSKYGDADPNDPWSVGLISEIGIDHKGTFVRIYSKSVKSWRNAVKIDKEESESILREYANYR